MLYVFTTRNQEKQISTLRMIVCFWSSVVAVWAYSSDIKTQTCLKSSAALTILEIDREARAVHEHIVLAWLPWCFIHFAALWFDAHINNGHEWEYAANDVCRSPCWRWFWKLWYHEIQNPRPQHGQQRYTTCEGTQSTIFHVHILVLFVGHIKYCVSFRKKSEWSYLKLELKLSTS